MVSVDFYRSINVWGWTLDVGGFRTARATQIIGTPADYKWSDELNARRSTIQSSRLAHALTPTLTEATRRYKRT